MSGLRYPSFVAPHFVEIEGRGDLPGPVWRACAFTTATAEAPGLARHHHHCLLRGAQDDWQEGAIAWTTETRPLLPQAGAPERMVTQGEAPGLLAAITAALGAAQRPTPDSTTLCLAPAFVAMAREPGLPGIWVCSQLSATGPVTAEQPWSEVQTAYIREHPGQPRPYHCTLESLPFAAVMAPSEAAPPQPRLVAHWTCPGLEAAIAECQRRMFAPRPAF